jgi:hypothetical protein
MNELIIFYDVNLQDFQEIKRWVMKWNEEEEVYGLEVIDGNLPNFINKGTNLNRKKNYKRQGPKFKLNCYKSHLRSQGGM